MKAAHQRIVVMLAITAAGLAVERIIGGSDANRQDDSAETVVTAVQHKAGHAASTPENRSAHSANGIAVQVERLALRQSAAAPASNPAQQQAAGSDAASDDIQPLFDSRSWQPPAPPPLPAAPPPKPHAPPFPYVFMGGLTDQEQRINFFTQGERVLAIKPGDTVDGAYRIDEISATQMRMTYLPLNESITLALRSRPQ